MGKTVAMRLGIGIGFRLQLSYDTGSLTLYAFSV